MSGNYWIKLYIEILDDSKMAILPDRLWRRVVELFLLAGRYHQDGVLPETMELAWALRMPTDDIEMDLKQIAGTGIIERTTTGWFIPKFAKRQEKMPPSEKMRLYRDRKQKEQYQGGSINVTDELLKVTQITDNRLTESESESESRYNSQIFQTGIEARAERVYQKVTGQVTFPSTNRLDAINVITRYLEKYSSDDAAIDALTPFWRVWRERKYKASNLNWLIDWAASGEIPEISTSNGYNKNDKPQSQNEGYTNVTQQRLAKQNTK